MTITPSTRFGGNASGLPIALCGTATTMDGADAGPASAPAAAASPDALLFGLGRAWTAMVERCAELDEQPAMDEQDSAAQMAARLMSDVLRRRIIATPARTLEGLAIKARVPGAMFNA